MMAMSKNSTDQQPDQEGVVTTPSPDSGRGSGDSGPDSAEPISIQRICLDSQLRADRYRNGSRRFFERYRDRLNLHSTENPLAAYSDAPIIPITIMGSRHCLPKNSMRIQPGSIHMVVSPPLETTSVTPKNIDDLVTRVHETITGRYVPEYQPA